MIKHHPVIIAALLLGLFAVAGSTLVAFTYENTRERIAENERQALLSKLHKLVPADTISNDIVNDTVTVSSLHQLGAASTVIYRARNNGQPVAAIFVTIAPDGYSGEIKMLVAVLADGTLGGVRIISHRETPGLGDKIQETKSNWLEQFIGKSLSNPEPEAWKVRRDGGSFDQITGATITPRAIVRAIKSTLQYFQENSDSVFTLEAALTGQPGREG